MAYPYALNTDLELPLDSTYNERTGPFFFGETRFGVFTDYVSNPQRLEVWKSENAGQTWTECDEGNHPEVVTPFTPSVFSADTDGTRIYIHFLHQGSHPSASVAVFDMSTEQWDAIYDGGPDVFGGDDPKFCVCDNGTGVLIWDGEQEEVNFNVYGRIWAVRVDLSSGAWGSAFMLRQGFEQSYFNAALVAGTGGRAHIFYYDATPSIIGSFCLRSNNSESADHEFWNDPSGDFSGLWGQPDKARADGKVIFAWHVQENSAPGTDTVYVSEAVSADSPSWSSPATALVLSFSSLTADPILDFGSLAVAWSDPADLPVLFWGETVSASPFRQKYWHKQRGAGGSWPAGKTLIYDAGATFVSHQASLSRVPGRVGAFFDFAPSPFSTYYIYYWEPARRRAGGVYSIGDSNEIA
jgi:hypothetical protein